MFGCKVCVAVKLAGYQLNDQTHPANWSNLAMYLHTGNDYPNHQENVMERMYWFIDF